MSDQPIQSPGAINRVVHYPMPDELSTASDRLYQDDVSETDPTPIGIVRPVIPKLGEKALLTPYEVEGHGNAGEFVSPPSSRIQR